MRPKSLYRRIYMHFIGVLIAVAAASSWIVSRGWQHGYIVEVAERIGAHTAALLAREPDMEARIAEARSLARELKLDLGLYDVGGIAILEVGTIVPPSDLRTLVAPRVFYRGTRWFVAAPVRIPNGPPLLLVCTPRGLDAWLLPVRPLAALFTVLVIVGIAVRPLARRISRPIEWLIIASRRFGAGDLGTRVELPRWLRKLHRRHHRWQHIRRHFGDELYTLIHTWNDMADRIERQVGAQRELLANVSHELRSPLARVRVALALLPDDPSTQKRIADIEADLGELDALIEEVLQTSRLEAIGLPTHTERFSVEVLIDEVLSRAAADPLTAPLAATRRPGSEIVTLDGDRGLLRRALFNLVENAAKYGAPPVLVGAERTADGLALTVSDSGLGIAPAERERVLRPFVRGDRAHTPGRGGVGLGLSFAARVAAVHGGRLELADANGRGLVVRLHLPTSRLVLN